jgi:hypothetical protein
VLYQLSYTGAEDRLLPETGWMSRGGDTFFDFHSKFVSKSPILHAKSRCPCGKHFGLFVVANWTAFATAQAGADTVITCDANNTITFETSLCRLSVQMILRLFDLR